MHGPLERRALVRIACRLVLLLGLGCAGEPIAASAESAPGVAGIESAADPMVDPMVDPMEAAAVEDILARLGADQDHAFLRTLEPELDDCRLLFRLERDALRACAYAEAMYAGLDVIDEASMKPVAGARDTLILRASPALIESGAAHPVFAPYAMVAVRLRPELTLYAFVFLDADGAPRKSRAALVRAGARWVFVPQLQRAFES